MATYPEQDVNKTKPRLQSDDRNPLHDFASYNCLFTLSGLSEEELQSQRLLFNPQLHDIIARSAGIGGFGENFANTKQPGNQNEDIFRGEATTITPKISADYRGSFNILSRGHDIFFENVNITSTVGPNTERNLANFTKMEFELHEPYGVTFIEKIRAAAFNSGYEDYQAAPFLLTIEWKGFDDNGKPLLDKAKGLVRKVPIFITRVDFDVDQGGARYNIVAVPYSEMAFDDSYKYPRTVIPVSVNNIYTWISQVKERLNTDQMQDEIDEGVRTYPDVYDFDVSRIREYIKDGQVITKQTSSIFNTATVDETTQKEPLLNDVGTPITDLQPSAKKQSMTLDANTSVVKAFEDMIRSSGYFQRLLINFWETFGKGETEETLANKIGKGEGLKGKSPYVNWFFVKPKLENITAQGLDPITKMYPKRITYQAVPYKVHVLKLITAGMSFGEVDWEKYARRRYNYIYTGDNIDIQNLRINYKTAYYYRNVRKDAKAVAGEEGKLEKFAEDLKKLFGVEKTPPEPTLPLRQYPSVLKQRNLVQEINPASNKAQEFFDYLTNPEADMINLEMEILGDPAYVAQDIFAPLEDKVLADGEYDAPNSSFNMQSYMPVVNLKYRIPADIDVKRGTMFSDAYLDENLFFSGAYQVTKVESSMNQGQFTQTLTMVRLNNQSGTGRDPVLRKAAIDGLIKEDKFTSEVRKGIQAAEDDN
jgi:hypothetical protein